MKNSQSKRPSPTTSAPSPTRTAARLRSALALGLTLALNACSGAQETPATAAAPRQFDPALAQLFDDDVDFVANVASLGSHFVAEWNRQIEGLASNSDLVAEARVEGVNRSTDSDGVERLTLTLALSHAVAGELPSDSHLSVTARRGGAGYRTLANNATRLQSDRFIVFARFYRSELGRTRAHWHLSAWSETLSEHLTPVNPNERVVWSSTTPRAR